MSRTPIEMMLDGTEWIMVEPPTDEEIKDAQSTGVPYVTHIGTLNIMGSELVCCQLSNGQRVFTEESIMKFFGMMENGETIQG
jgi:hypothetical protein